GFAHNFKEADVTSHSGVGATAEFHADFRNRNHSNLLLILFAKKSERAFGNGFVDVHYSCLNWEVSEDDLIDLLLNFFDLAIGQWGEMRIVESQAVGCHQRSSLFHMRSQSVS